MNNKPAAAAAKTAIATIVTIFPKFPPFFSTSLTFMLYAIFLHADEDAVPSMIPNLTAVAVNAEHTNNFSIPSEIEGMISIEFRGFHYGCAGEMLV
ncbi:TPA: hypothetical protein EYP26_01300 [Candidatus Bathyarchaeota archaeon]|nr:hypothetical protein [Candidatus Bathyarchaeota archaeon]